MKGSFQRQFQSDILQEEKTCIENNGSMCTVWISRFFGSLVYGFHSFWMSLANFFMFLAPLAILIAS